MAQKKKWSPKAKFEIALLALKGDTTINEICQRYNVAPSQVHAWKRQMLNDGAKLFEKSGKLKGSKESTNNEAAQNQLYAKIGQLTVERDFLKKTWSKLSGEFDES